MTLHIHSIFLQFEKLRAICQRKLWRDVTKLCFLLFLARGEVSCTCELHGRLLDDEVGSGCERGRYTERVIPALEILRTDTSEEKEGRLSASCILIQVPSRDIFSMSQTTYIGPLSLLSSIRRSLHPILPSPRYTSPSRPNLRNPHYFHPVNHSTPPIHPSMHPQFFKR